MAETCKECGCKCGTCSQDGQQQQQQQQKHCDMHLHVEIEDLRQRLLERDNHIVTMETQFLSEADKFPNGELASMREELSIWQEKYSRLHEAHKRVQKVNQNLEDKLLRIVDKCETEKGAFTKDIATLSHRLADANYTIHRLTQDNEKYRNDVNLAIQLLQCKPSNFVGQKYDSLPTEVQAKVRTYVAQKRCPAQDATQQDVKSITVPISTFPPTAMVYNVTKPTVEKHSDDDSEDERPPVDVVSAAIMAKVLEDREKERVFARHCDTCTCHRSILTVDAETQTCAPDAPPFLHGHAYSVDRQAPEDVPGGETHPSRDNKLQPSLATIFYEVNESGDRARHQVNGNCSKHAPQPARDKLVGRGGRGAQDGATEESCAKAGLSKKNPAAHDGKRSPSFSKLNDLNRINADKASKALRASNSRNCDGSSADGRSAARCWSKSERGTFGPIGSALDGRVPDKEQTHVDIINDRLWKNEWTKTRGEKTGLAMREGRCRPSRDIELDVINDRDWRNDRPAERGAARFAVIEVKSPDNGAALSQNDGSQTEATTTSPSFSSDSMLISSSDPSSSCSDVAQPLSGAFNSGDASSGQARAAGPRNCLVRVTPGSKNILLDNAGHYKAVVYSSGSGGKASTALVHAKKGSRAGSERSISTGSEDNSPLVLLQDNHLQRVAEWVQSSMRAEEPAQFASNKAKRAETGLSAPKSPGVPIREPRDASRKSSRRTEDRGKNRGEHDEAENLITFDAPEERRPSKEPRGKDLDYEVKITKEMEETYLKLAASLDPVALSLTSAGDAELTIEKYRKDHKRLHVQRVQDKTGSKA